MDQPSTSAGAAADRAMAEPTGWGRYAFGAGFALAAGLTGLAILLTAAAPVDRSLARSSDDVLRILALDLLLIAGLATAIGVRALRLFGPRARDAGVRLHRRFVGLFAMAAVAPAVVVALFFGLLVTRGVENWFSSRIRTVVDGSATIADGYVNEQLEFVQTRLGAMARDLNLLEPTFGDRLTFSQVLDQAVQRDFSAVYIIDSQARVLARAQAPGAPPFLAPPPSTIASAADPAKAPGDGFPNEDAIRALYKLRAYPDAYLYVTRPVAHGILNQLLKAKENVLAYREAGQNRARIQAVFAVSYVSTALLVLIGAVWVGMSLATQITAPVGRLVQAADRVAGGDLDARVDTRRDPEEIAVLSRAFNRMTHDLQVQQTALRDAGREAEARRSFIEAVLAGVSAGVVGLDVAGRISATNRRALELLGLDEGSAIGRRLVEAAPELDDVVARAAATGAGAEGEVDVVRRAETRRLRVRAGASVGGGLVLTFDDISRLVAAQRNAAWRDVARRIAHEIKNPLTPIQLSAERIRRKYRREITHDVETFDRCTDTIIRQVGDIGRMVDEFSSFARMPAPKFATTDAVELLKQAVFAQRVAYADTPVELTAPEGGPVLLVCDAGLVGQALGNVLKNAGEAIAGRRAKQPELQGSIRASLVTTPSCVVFEVEDNGVGLPPKDRERLTEPYVTTREKGTGLGLAIVKRILEEHGGELTLTDAVGGPGSGARAILRIPRTTAPPSPIPARPLHEMAS